MSWPAIFWRVLSPAAFARAASALVSAHSSATCNQNRTSVSYRSNHIIMQVRRLSGKGYQMWAVQTDYLLTRNMAFPLLSALPLLQKHDEEAS